jgi:hypothetical protein
VRDAERELNRATCAGDATSRVNPLALVRMG